MQKNDQEVQQSEGTTQDPNTEEMPGEMIGQEQDPMDDGEQDQLDGSEKEELDDQSTTQLDTQH